METYVKTSVQCYMTPADLIRIAHKMEQAWEEKVPGESNLVETWYGRGCEIEFRIDQDRMEKRHD